MQRNLILLPAVTAILAVLSSSCAKKEPSEASSTPEPKPTVVITVDPPDVKVDKVNVKSEKKSGVEPSAHEIARTDWMFSIKPELKISIKDEKQDKTGYHLTLEVTGVKLTLALPIRTTVSEKAPQDVLDHEKGHVQICRRAYANARAYASDAAEKVVGKRFEGFGSDRKLALSNAVEMAAQDIAAPYRTKTAALAENVSSIYDQLCEKENRKKLVQKTIEEAFATVKEAELKEQEYARQAAEKRARQRQKTVEKKSP